MRVTRETGSVLPPQVENWPTYWREELADTTTMLVSVCGQRDGWTRQELHLIAEAATRRKYRMERAAERILAEGRADADADAFALAVAGTLSSTH